MATVMFKKLLPALAVAGIAVACGLGSHPAVADQARKKPRASPAASSAAPTRAGDLNSPATDFSDMKPIIDDPKAELLKPKKKKDFFD